MNFSLRALDYAFEPLPPRVPAATRVYAVGDIHGRADLLDAMHVQILADSANGPARQVVVYLGDYIDRGPDSFGVIDRLSADPLPGFHTVYLKATTRTSCCV
ncbi:MAG: metallophosphoesterase [Rhodospirillaceae bacterium]